MDHTFVVPPSAEVLLRSEAGAAQLVLAPGGARPPRPPHPPEQHRETGRARGLCPLGPVGGHRCGASTGLALLAALPAGPHPTQARPLLVSPHRAPSRMSGAHVWRGDSRKGPGAPRGVRLSLQGEGVSRGGLGRALEVPPAQHCSAARGPAQVLGRP